MEGDVKKESKEFVYDYSYWSVAERDPHFVNQEQVKTTSLGERSEPHMGDTSGIFHILLYIIVRTSGFV